MTWTGGAGSGRVGDTAGVARGGVGVAEGSGRGPRGVGGTGRQEGCLGSLAGALLPPYPLGVPCSLWVSPPGGSQGKAVRGL